MIDTTGRVVKVAPLGPILSFSRPEAHVDPLSNLHVLYQDRPHLFSYTAYNPDGELLLRQSYEFDKTHPRLQLNTDNKVTVIGGIRQVSNNDFPPPPKETAATDKPKPAGAEEEDRPVEATAKGLENNPPKA